MALISGHIALLTFHCQLLKTKTEETPPPHRHRRAFVDFHSNPNTFLRCLIYEHLLFGAVLLFVLFAIA